MLKGILQTIGNCEKKEFQRKLGKWQTYSKKRVSWMRKKIIVLYTTWLSKEQYLPSHDNENNQYKFNILEKSCSCCIREEKEGKHKSTSIKQKVNNIFKNHESSNSYVCKCKRNISNVGSVVVCWFLTHQFLSMYLFDKN